MIYIDRHGRRCRLLKRRSGYRWAWLKPEGPDPAGRPGMAAPFRVRWEDLPQMRA